MEALIEKMNRRGISTSSIQVTFFLSETRKLSICSSLEFIHLFHHYRRHSFTQEKVVKIRSVLLTPMVAPVGIRKKDIKKLEKGQITFVFRYSYPSSVSVLRQNPLHLFITFFLYSLLTAY